MTDNITLSSSLIGSAYTQNDPYDTVPMAHYADEH